ncbi:hypothetical protein F4804DRAFT_122588 [Jackrogersella minutella]|nr:hypothetical protein F4804DRAFT_122588 [Jackrogersella minutella]
MEHHRLPRHSSSHGTLHSSYSHGRPAHGPSPGRPLHKPLRSVNENSVLLPSPGALESMLKTTTETGDIGIFSIKPVPPSPQRRDTLSEIGQQHPSPRPSMDELRRRNNGKNPSSCRDTTSEIISMYGSESHKSTTSTLTPTSSEEIGLRSYSMTTCGSRHLSHHRSTTTLQSQTSGGPLQRPRSPFPYPTRLKRPGVRPASPALTETGRVDYSRMVEIDRSSYRTVHGPYKPFYPPMLRRPPPLGFHVDATLSSVSLPSQGPPHNRHGPLGPPSIRTHSAASMVSWDAPYRERVDSSSSRASSLTSVVNVYHRTPHRVRPSGLSAAVPRYYDYTEEFESRQPRTLTPVQPLAPVPTHASNYRRPLVLQESDDNLAVAFLERDSAFFEPESQSLDRADTAESMRGTNTPQAGSCRTMRDRAPSHCRTASIRSGSTSFAFKNSEVDRKFERGSDIDLLPSQAGRDSMDTFNPNLDLESSDALPYRCTNYHSTATPKTTVNSPERQVQVQGGGAPTIRSEQGVILRDDTQDEIPHEELDGSDEADLIDKQALAGPHDNNAVKRRSYSEPVKDPSKHPIVHEALLDGQYKFVTMHHTSSHYSKSGILPSATAPNRNGKFNYGTSDGNTPAANMDASNNKCDDVRKSDVASSSNQESGIAQRYRFQRHKRNQAVPRISTGSLPREDNEGFPYITPSCSTTPIVSPKPISPARQLKLKNSIPQLMKALPPLPGDPDYIPPPTPSILSTSSNEGDFSEVLSPFMFPSSSSPRLLKDTNHRNTDSTPNDDRTPGPQKYAPRLRLKTKMSNDSAATDSSDTRLCGTDVGQSWSTRAPNPILEGKEGDSDIRVRPRNRLKLRSSRSTTASTPPSTTVRRNAIAETSDFLVDIARQRPRDLFAFPSGLTPAPHSASKKPSQPSWVGHPSSGSLDEIVPKEVASQLEKRAASAHADHRSNPHYDSRSIEARGNSRIRHPRGLKRRFSNLRFLLARPTDSVPAASDWTTEEAKQGRTDRDVCQTNLNIGNKLFTTLDGRSTQGNNHRTKFGRRVRSKLLKWVKDAKAAVRACAKRNHGA